MKITSYKGQKDAVIIDRFLSSVDNALEKSKEDSIGKAQYLATHLDGEASMWLSVYIRQIGDVNNLTYEGLRKGLRDQFYPFDHEYKCKKEFLDLRQTGSVRAYAERFNYLLSQIPVGYVEICYDRFVHGLNGYMKLQAHISQKKSLVDLIPYLVKLDEVAGARGNYESH